MVAKWFIDLVLANWPLVLGLAVVLVAGLVGMLVVRRRMIDARQREWLRENAHLERVDRMTGVQFESLVEALLQRDGFHKVHRIGGSGDGGVDVIGTAPTGDRFVVQCKRWTKSVGSPEVRNLLGALHAYPDHRGVLVATAHFTAPAKQCAVGTDLILIDREQLAAWLTGSFALALSARATGGSWPLRRPVSPPPESDLGLEDAG
ncbi:restriction endonuclease [Streptosporangium canum]|uniref:restriction endonuclease n=1 Tax=Streptosporangium canum TaxID=324952 RepID=UPI0015A68027|nr:restriction endonuclease [Streptosporangium canum]